MYSMGGFRIGDDCYIKDMTSWKTNFETKHYQAGFYLPTGSWVLSEPVDMENEWRYYVADGDLITTGWYRGQDEEAQAPVIEFPKGFSGAADFAMVNGKPELIECHAPFACGWYGENHIDYVYWQYFAWKQKEV